MPDAIDTRKTGTNLQSFAYGKIREQIICCRLAPGRKISAKAMEDYLGIGRTPVREALVRLGQQGLVRSIPQSGTYVSKIDMHAAENARYVREHLEQSVTVECCARLDDSGIERLTSLIERQERSLSDHDPNGFFLLDNEFHEELFRIAGRHDIWRWIASSNTDLERFRWLRTQVRELDWNTIMDQHRKLLEAICARSPEEAGFLTGVHLHLMVAEQDAVVSAFPDYFEC